MRYNTNSKRSISGRRTGSSRIHNTFIGETGIMTIGTLRRLVRMILITRQTVTCAIHAADRASNATNNIS